MENEMYKPEKERKLEIDKQMQALNVCKCTMRTKLLGDGCDVCNPELAKELEGDDECEID